MATRMAHSVFILILAFFLGFSQAASAQDVKVEALVSESTIGDQETLSFSIEIQGVSFADVETPQPPETEGLALLQTYPSTRRNMTFNNGQLSQSIAYEWTFRPVRTGTATLKPTTLTVKDKSYTTEEVSVEVVPQAQRPARRQPSSLFSNPFGQTPTQADPQAEPESRISDRDIFIRAVPSARRAYQNEQVTIEYQLFFRNFIQPRHSRLADSWDAEGFWREELDVEARPMPRTVTENGLRYNMIVLKRVAVFPTHSGTLQVDPLRIETEVFAPRSSDPFSRFFSSANPYETIERASPAIGIEALPLPDSPPASFRGAVGQFEMDVEVNRTAVEVGEPVQITARISGTGNIAMLEPPPLEAPGIFEPYEPEVIASIDNGGQRVRGAQTFTYLLVPRSNGTFDLPALEFSYFDPSARRYKTLRSDPTSISVTGTANVPIATSSTASGMPVDDIAQPLTTATWTKTTRNPLHSSTWAYLLVTLPILFVGGVYGYRRYANKLATDTAYARNRKAHPLARKHLKHAEALLQKDEPRAFYEELERAVLGFVGNRMNIAELGMTRPQLDATLHAAGLSEEIRLDLQDLLGACDQARFAPNRPTTAQMETSLDKAHNLIISLDAAFVQQTASTSA